MRWLRRQAARIAGLALIASLYVSARLPEPSAEERHGLASRFRFVRLPLPTTPGPKNFRYERPVHPGLEHISGWVSSVGAAVALTDADGDGLANDICYVDTRLDEVIVARVPGTEGLRRAYDVFALNPKPLPYDAETMAPMGCLPSDLNEDGQTDFLVYYWGRTPIVFLSDGDHSQRPLEARRYRPQELVAGRQRWYTNAVASADADGDGHVDLIIGNYFADGSRILDAHAGRNDGSPEMQDSMSRALNAGRNRILLCRPRASGVAGAAVECAEAPGALDDDVARGWTLAVAAADLDGDLRPEIYFANDFGPDRLLLNRSEPGRPCFVSLVGTKGFTTPGSKVLGRDSFKGMGVDFGDVDGDGVLDIYVSNIAAPYALEESHFVFIGTGDVEAMTKGRAPYVDRSESLGLSRSGWGWDVKLADFDNDGVPEALQAIGFLKGDVNRWPELHELAMGNDTLLRHPGSWPRFKRGDDLSGDRGNAFFARDSRGTYVDLAADLGLVENAVTRGLAIADVDGDGDLDFAVANQWAPSAFYRNDSPRPGSFLGLRLLLPAGGVEAAATTVCPGHRPTVEPTRPAVGATAVVHRPRIGSASRGQILVGQVDGGNGHSGKRSPELLFGLGDVAPDQEVRVDLSWRDGRGHVHGKTLSLSPRSYTVILGTEEEGTP